MDASAATVKSLCEQIEADLIFLRERTEAGGRIRDYLIRRRVGELDFLEVRYAQSLAGPPTNANCCGCQGNRYMRLSTLFSRCCLILRLCVCLCV